MKSSSPCNACIVPERTTSYNRLRGLVSEFGLIAPQSTEQLRRLAREHRENLPGWVSQCVDDLLSHIDSIELKIAEYGSQTEKIKPALTVRGSPYSTLPFHWASNPWYGVI
jgi:transposase